MARTLSSAIQSLIGQDTQHVCHLLTFTVGAATYRFAEDAVTHNGNVYQARLILDGGPNYSEQLKLEPVTVRLQNITLETAKLLKDEASGVLGQEATLERLFLQANEAVVLFKGRISEVAVDERDAQLALAG